MIAPLAKFIDRSVLQIGYAMLPQSTWREAANERDLKLEQAVQFLNGPDFIPAESQPAQLDFMLDASGGRFRFLRRDHPSSRRTTFRQQPPAQTALKEIRPSDSSSRSFDRSKT
jgi:hypothetical protein